MSDAICTLFGFYEQQRSHILFLILISTKKFLFGSLLCIYLTLLMLYCFWYIEEIHHHFFFRSSLNGVQKPCNENWEAGKESSRFISVIIKMSISSATIFLSKSNFFLMEFIFKWPIMMFLGWFKRSCLRRNSGEFLSIPKLSKETEFNVSRVGALLKNLNSL